MLSSLISEGAANGIFEISLHCRDGLESNRFWQACGLHLSSIIPGGHTRRKVVNVWTLQLSEALSLPTHPYAADFLSTLRGRQEGSQTDVGEQEGSRLAAFIQAATAATAAATPDVAFAADSVRL
jgi:hypothetical protein